MITYKYPSIHASTERKRYGKEKIQSKTCGDKERQEENSKEIWRVGVSKKIKKLIKSRKLEKK